MRYPNCRNSDKDLIIGVLQALGADLTPKQREIMRSVNFESIRRYRQKLQEEGKYLPVEEVSKQRHFKSLIIQQNSPTSKPDTLQSLIEDQPVGIPWIDYEP